MTTKDSNKAGTTINRFKRLIDVQLLDDGTKTVKEIAVELCIPESSVTQSKKYLKELLEYGLSLDTVQQKRSEFYLEYCQACQEAKQLFEKYRDKEGSSATDIKRMLVAWVEIIDKKARLFGFDSVKTGDLNIASGQFNQQNIIVDSVDQNLGKKIADIMKEDHEKALQEKEIIDV